MAAVLGLSVFWHTASAARCSLNSSSAFLSTEEERSLGEDGDGEQGVHSQTKPLPFDLSPFDCAFDC